MRRSLAALGAALALLGLGAAAAAAEPDIKGLRLGMALPEGEIEAVYEGRLAAELADSVGLTVPYDHIETKLTDGSRLSLHFSSIEDGTRLFWIRHSTSWQWPVERPAPELASLLKRLEERYGAPARAVGPGDGNGDLLLVYPADASGPVPVDLPLAPQDVGGVQFLSFQQRVALLGPDFVGAMVTIIMHEGEVAAMVEELIDHPRGATVLNPGD